MWPPTKPDTPLSLTGGVAVIASALAMSWEVGSFVPIGADMFPLFSFSEHLIFAYTALPFALLLSALPLIVWLLGKHRREPRPVGALFALLLVLLLVLGLCVSLVGLSHRGATVFFLGLLIMWTAHPFSPKPIPQSVSLVLVILWSFGFAFASGIDSTRLELVLKSKVPSPTVRLKGSGRAEETWCLIRSGDRVALMYDPINHNFRISKWDEIESIELRRSDVLENVPRYVPGFFGRFFKLVLDILAKQLPYPFESRA